MKWFSCLPLVVLSLTVSATDGNELLRWCNALVKQADGGSLEDPEEFFGATFCAGYLAGFTDSHSVEHGTFYCLPENGVEGVQLARIVTKHLRESPDTLHENPRMSILIALARTFPCGGKG